MHDCEQFVHGSRTRAGAVHLCSAPHPAAHAPLAGAVESFSCQKKRKEVAPTQGTDGRFIEGMHISKE